MPHHPQLLEDLSQGLKSGQGDSGDQEGYGDWKVIISFVGGGELTNRIPYRRLDGYGSWLRRRTIIRPCIYTVQFAMPHTLDMYNPTSISYLLSLLLLINRSMQHPSSPPYPFRHPAQPLDQPPNEPETLSTTHFLPHPAFPHPYKSHHFQRLTNRNSEGSRRKHGGGVTRETEIERENESRNRKKRKEARRPSLHLQTSPFKSDEPRRTG
jgi:hypothetical protein